MVLDNAETGQAVRAVVQRNERLEEETELVEGASRPRLRYDALGRLIRTDPPNGTFSKRRSIPGSKPRSDPERQRGSAGSERHAVMRARIRRGRRSIPSRILIRAAALAYAYRDAWRGAPGRLANVLDDRATMALRGARRASRRDVEGNPLVITDARERGCVAPCLRDGRAGAAQKRP
jgi:hypothetical protein